MSSQPNPPLSATRSAPRGGSLVFALTIFVSAFLLFQVQPLVSKVILPWFGGSPAVWTTCMLFFQLVLLAGYAYAHFATRRMEIGRATLVHVGLLVVALFCLPVVPSDRWKPDPTAAPVGQILTLLAATVGIPYFLLSTTGPLVQAWYHRWSGGASPYRLYALSNVGSLGALLTYPFLVEPAMGTKGQGWVWSGLFVLFAICCSLAAWLTRRPLAPLASEPLEKPASAPQASLLADRIPRPLLFLIWFALPTIASVMLLAVTSHISQDIAVFPFLWILPLSLYLLSFIICFDHPRWYRPVINSLFLLALITGIAVLAKSDAANEWLAEFTAAREVPAWLEPWLVVPEPLDHLWLEVGLYAGAMFALCMLCHGEVVRLRPHARHLTAFYLMIAAGGALGGLLTAVVFPRVFTSYFEVPLGWIVGSVVAVAALAVESLRRGRWWVRWPQRVIGVMAIVLLTQLIPGLWPHEEDDVVDQRRNFFGVLRVVEWYPGTDDHHYSLYNGRILHGVQLLGEGKKSVPTTYYSEDSGVGIAITMLPSRGPVRVGTIGLGAGTIASYGGKGDHYTFYEINPAVVELNRKWFTFLSDMAARGGRVDIALGDARLSLERQSPQQFDVLAIDAFTGDAIPAHLLTREAFAVYLRHMKPGGVIAVHTSNRHLDLNPVVAAAAAHYGLRLLQVEADDAGGVGDAASDWLLMTRNADFCDIVTTVAAGKELDVARVPQTEWTDDYSSLWQILNEMPWDELRPFWEATEEEGGFGNEP